jgi:hypothetical protein
MITLPMVRRVLLKIFVTGTENFRYIKLPADEAGKKAALRYGVIFSQHPYRSNH